MATPPRRHPNVVRAEDLPARAFTKGSRFGLASRVLGRATGARGIGYSLFEVPPGRAAFPHHYHCANEEAVYILEGDGSLRLGTETIPVSAGDYATFPVGPEHAHQLLNTGQVPLRYLCFSTMLGAEVVGYPDSRKIAALGYGPERGGEEGGIDSRAGTRAHPFGAAFGRPNSPCEFVEPKGSGIASALRQIRHGARKGPRVISGGAVSHRRTRLRARLPEEQGTCRESPTRTPGQRPRLPRPVNA